MFLKSLTLVLLTLPLSVNAALIDHGSFTTDSSTHMDWLDLDVVAGLSFTEALLQNPGWRLPSHTEIEGLFGELFEGYYETNALQHWSRISEGAYADQGQDISLFLNLFGETTNRGAYGMYQDETATWRMMGAGGDIVYGTEVTQDNSFWAENGIANRGVYLTRNLEMTTQEVTAIPLPTTALLFSSAVIGLALTKRKRVAL
ncbi:hypothetical protein [Oceanicoccus sagamiensis]|uniref:PEP-CTERM protein-sorting domain-containing protein n=1 Tax=Oceanicoccus sagamiensis TaxID=716816 RepID=A0A1X9N8J8_9GAMM|nr:hypothetical protein [Oceanicoccus sagamiensis]ARN74380.1 hypothetical protein BST96_09745 [Oceanicoccus sagamiensis]